MATDLNTILQAPLKFVQEELIPGALAGDILFIAILFFALMFVAAIILMVVEVTSWILGLVKRFIVAIIIFVLFFLFLFNFQHRLFAPQPDFALLVIGAIVLLMGIFAIIISLFSMKTHVYMRKIYVAETPPEEAVAVQPAVEVAKEVAEKAAEAEAAVKAGRAVAPTAQMAAAPEVGYALSNFLSLQGWKNQLQSERSLLAVISYLVIGEFGVFSSVTLPAPSAEIGLGVFGIFLLAVLVFIKSTYADYKKGLIHLGVALLFGFILSIVLGFFWGGIPLGTLISIEYFHTNCLVAFISGLAISLFMGSRG